MAAKFSLILCVLAIWAVALAHGGSSHLAPAPSVDCSTVVLTLADCLTYVTNGSTTTKPEGTCCPNLKTVLKTAPACLCEAFKSSAQFGVVLNVTKALTLPAACKVSAPSATNCGLSETPAAAPAAAASTSRQAAAASTSRHRKLLLLLLLHATASCCCFTPPQAAAASPQRKLLLLHATATCCCFTPSTHDFNQHSGSLSPESSPTPSAAAPGLKGAASELSPTPLPSPGNAASALFPISAGSLLLCLLLAIVSGF